MSPSAASGGGLCWRRLLVAAAAATAAIVVLPFDLMHFTILNLSLMFVEYFLCLLITYIIPLCSFTMFLFYKLDARTPVHTFAVLVSHMTNFVLFIDTPWLYFAVLVHLLYVCFAVLSPCSHLFLVPQTSA